MKAIFVEMMLYAERAENGDLCYFLPRAVGEDLDITDDMVADELIQAEQAYLYAEEVEHDKHAAAAEDAAEAKREDRRLSA